MHRQPASRRVPRAAFTLIEVLLVLVILVIMGSLAVGMFGNTQKKAKIDAAKSQIGIIDTQIPLYELHVGSMPPDLQSLRTPPGDAVAAQKWAGPYLDKDPIDPWENQYQFVYPGTQHPEKYDIWSMGPDGQNGTEDDIYN